MHLFKAVKMDSIKCDFCDARFGAKRSLKRHYQTIHDEVPDSFSNVRDPLSTCDDCGKEVKNLTDHKKFCKVMTTPMKAKPSKLAASAATSRGIQSPSTAMQSLQIGGQDGARALQDAAGDGGLVSEEAFYQRFINFVVEREGGSGNTASQYKRRLENFALFIRRDNPEFQWGQTLNFRHLATVEEYTSIPTCFRWVNTHESCSNQHGAVNAYLKLVDYLNFELYELQHVLNHNLRIILKDKFLGLRGDASNLLTKLQKKIIPARRQKLAEQSNLEEETEISMEEMKRCCDFYRDSPWRLSMYEKLKDMEAAHVKLMTPVEIRNFCALEVLFEAGGQRPEVIKKITIGDLFNATSTTATGLEKKVIHISQHKTSKTHGLANIIIPKKTFNLLLQYQAHFVETEVENYYDSFLFVSSGSGKQLDRLDQCCKLFASVTKTDSKIIPKSFRYLVAHLGQTFDDQQVRDKLPGHMNHSRETASLHYVREQNKAAEHNVMLSKVYGESSKLPEYPEFEGLEEEREAVNAAKKAKLEEGAQKKDENFVAHQRHVFAPSEKTLIVNTFKSVKQSNLKRSDYDKALEESEEFRELVESHKNQGKDDLKVFNQVANSFRSTRRK